MKSSNTTLCYIRKNDKFLMLHRISKKNDINKGKWIGVGGHFEEGESPDDCLIREVKEETGYILNSYLLRGIVTFNTPSLTEYMFLYTSDDFSGSLIDCDEGKLEWIEINKINELNLWDGDRIFFELLVNNAPFFSLKLTYDDKEKLVGVRLDGREIDSERIKDKKPIS